MNEIISTENYTRAVQLHKKIVTAGKLAQESMYEMCTALKELRDSRLYKELGYSEFNDYCRDSLDISDRQAYNYIKIAENLSEDLVKSISLNGTTKLSLIATLTEEQRTEIMQNTDVSEATVKELKAEIAKLKQANEESNAENQRLSERNAELEEENEELSNRPTDVAVVDNSKEVENMRKAMVQLNTEHEKALSDIQEDNIKVIRKLNDDHNAAINRMKSEYEQRIAEAQKSAPAASADTKAVFRAYLSNAVDSAKRLIEFVKANPDELYKSKTTDFFRTILKEV